MAYNVHLQVQIFLCMGLKLMKNHDKNIRYSASGLKSKLFVFLVLWYILLSISSIKCHKRARFGENVAELLLIPYICINHIENESRYHIYSILYTRFFRQSAKSL